MNGRDRTRAIHALSARRRTTHLVLAAIATLAPLFAGCGSAKPPAPDTEITIKTTPVDGAEVIISGQSRGLTPLTLKGLPPGFTDIVLKKEKFKRTFDRIEIRAGGPQVFTIELLPLVGYVNFSSIPDGAEVLIDGQSAGRTPLYRHPVQVGEHTYAMRLENHYPAEGTLKIEEDFEYNERIELKGMEATLQVTSRPTGANIWLNEQLQSRKTPSTFTLQPGDYIVAVHSPGHVREETRLHIAANQQQSVNLVMKPGEVPAGMVLVPAGEFSMGADDRAPEEVPLRKLDLPAFYIDKFEVTNLEYKQVFPRHTYPEGQDNFPVTGVTWNEAQEYARAVRKRLPTEAEWEKAARGEAGLEYPWGNEFDAGRCNSEEGGKRATTRVGSYIRGGSPYGCMDMAGNVYEWVQDLYAPYPGNDKVQVDYGQIFRVLRGGSYKTDRFDVRGAARHFDKPDAKKPDYGFRCAMDVK